MEKRLVHPRANVLGVSVSALTMEEALETIHDWIVRREQNYVCTLDVHALVESRSALDIHEIYQHAGMVAADGMPLVWLLRRRGYPAAERVCGPDLMPALFRASEQLGYRHFLYGSTETTLVRLQAELNRQFPKANIVGSYSPPFRALAPEEERHVDELLNSAAPDIVWVGLGAPKQERWMAARRPSLDAPVLIGVGAAFDMFAGTVKRAPPMLRQTGCEWMFRLSQEPKRLARRYLQSNSKFVMLLIQERLHSLTQ
ncbi:MAG: N-acetylglucosaminyldiphosphoundecaprenol N-acetyl-beta-D-mannosaminyltransferase [Bradyrhizobium sp.]|nr:N-acetylglucosaminyldiphosphoundecaprenol N-acetyl-beta-D-mannosaminyltransferase [Bradyrhizobium sp.]